MRYEVPQFIEVEDKIFGPFTLKQFIYGLGGIGLAVIAFMFLPSFLALPIGIISVGSAYTLGFVKIEMRPSVIRLEAMFNYFRKEKLYLWKKVDKPVTEEEDIVSEVQSIVAQPYVPRLSDSKLKDLSWALDIDERNKGEVL